MWGIISIIIFIVEILLLIGFVIGRFHKRRLNETAIFIGIVIIVTYSLHAVPFLYEAFELGKESNIILGLLGSFGSAIKLFVGEPKVDSATAAFTDAYSIFAVDYLLGLIIALLTTISTAIEAFSNSIINGLRIGKAMNKGCDIVVGNGATSLCYAKNSNGILLLDDSVDKGKAKELIEEGYAVLRKGFTAKLLGSRLFNHATRYNIICPYSDLALSYIETFITYKKGESTPKNIYLYVELEGEKAETIRREIVEKNGMGSYIDTFCTNELLARTFVEENPVTKHLPQEFIVDGAIKSGTQINLFILGYGNLTRQIFYQSAMNNQLVTFDGEYKVLPINYHLCDKNIDASHWMIGGMAKALGQLKESDYFPLPELPYNVNLMDENPASYEVMSAVKNQVQKDNGYTLVVVDTDDDCRNIEIGAKLKSMLFGAENYHIYIRSEAAYTESDHIITYFGSRDRVFNHDVIVNDSLSAMAKRINQVYTTQDADETEQKRDDFDEYIKVKAADKWSKLDYFTLYSNIYAAMNLRTKLNLLGLDYLKDGKAENNWVIKKRFEVGGDYDYKKRFTPSVRNALIAQEHARWNAYHLLNEWLPLEKEGITVNSKKDDTVRFDVKSMEAKKHACLTPYKGLDGLSAYLAKKADNGATASDYDYYVYDQMLVTSAEEVLNSLGYSTIIR